MLTARPQIVFLVITAAVSFACSAKGPGREPAGATSTPAQEQSTPAPALAEVNEAITRVYQDTVVIETNRSHPFFVGDFNGDGSQDLAVIVKPAKGALPKLNSEYANWILEEPRKVVLPDPNKGVQHLSRTQAQVRVQQDDELLLILHGYQQAGWHHRYARQTFLLRNAIGEDLRTQSLSEVSKSAGKENVAHQLTGDILQEKLDGHEGFLYWTRDARYARYAWHE